MPVDIHDIEARLWDAADELRANSKLKSSEYCGRPRSRRDAGGSVYLVDLVGITLGPLEVTAIDLGNGPAVSCPACLKRHALQETWLGRELECPGTACNARLRVNPFIAGRRVRERARSDVAPRRGLNLEEDGRLMSGGEPS
jgi:hypothetical protein